MDQRKIPRNERYSVPPRLGERLWAPETPPVPKRGLTIGPDGHGQEYWGAVLEALGHTVGVETWHGSIPDREISNVLN
ncbi:MAG: hypothetical protein O6850_03970, partial [Acidobacteria bacterium]|nr:hypothetical protein [Acidobacteriota bacterium]